MFGRTTAEAARLPYREFVKPGVTFRRETVTAIDPVARRVTTNAGVHDADPPPACECQYLCCAHRYCRPSSNTFIDHHRPVDAARVSEGNRHG